MPMFLDIHRGMDHLTAEVARGAHEEDVKVRDKYGVKFIKYWFSEKDGIVFCLSEAPNKDATVNVHRNSHGLMPDEIVEVKEGR